MHPREVARDRRGFPYSTRLGKPGLVIYRSHVALTRGAVQHSFCKKLLSDFSGYGLTKFEIQVDGSSHPSLITLREQG